MDSSLVDAPSLTVRMFSLPGTGMSPSSGNILCPVLKYKAGAVGGGGAVESEILPASAVSQVPLAQNNPYAKPAYFGVARPSLP